MPAASSTSDLIRDLQRIDVDGPPLHDWWSPRLREAFGTDGAMTFTVRTGEVDIELDRGRLSGLGERVEPLVVERFRTLSRGRSGLWTLYDPRRVDSGQQNRAVFGGSLRALVEGEMPTQLRRVLPGREVGRRLESVRDSGVWDVYRTWGAIDAGNLRALVCDGERLLAWVGVLHLGPFAAGATQQLQSLVAPLRRRLLIEERLAESPLPRGLVAALLDEIPGAAYVLDGKRRVVAANSAGRDRLEREPSLANGLRTRPEHPDRTVIELASRGVPDHRLVVERRSASVGPVALRVTQTRYGLTARETEVLAQVAWGKTNRAAGIALGCGERTVETHVRRILDKMDCSSRSELVGLLWASAH